jgi:hypothetical protein
LAEKEAISIGGKAMIREAAWQRVHGNAGSRRQERRQDVEGGVIQGIFVLKERAMSKMVIELTLETTGRGMQHQSRARQRALVCKEVVVVH